MKYEEMIKLINSYLMSDEIIDMKWRLLLEECKRLLIKENNKELK